MTPADKRKLDALTELEHRRKLRRANRISMTSLNLEQERWREKIARLWNVSPVKARDK